MTVLALGLGGCAMNQSSTVHNNSQEPASANSEKHVTNHNANKLESQQSSNNINPANAHTSSSYAASTQQTSSTSTPAPTNNQASRTNKQKQSTNNQIQLGLGDTAVWEDEYGILHHVDSDGMDRQTITGSDEVHYQDWSGALPSNAHVIHND